MTGKPMTDELRERVRDFIYDCTKDESNTGWTLSSDQADDLIAIVSSLPNHEGQVTEALVEAVALAMAKEIGWGTFSHFDPNDMRRVARAAARAATGTPETTPIEGISEEDAE